MAEKPQPSIPEPISTETAVLAALSSILRNPHASFQLYTSRRNRTWFAIRQWGTPPYTSAAECGHPIGPATLTLAIGHACLTHARKLRGELPLADTWTAATEAAFGHEMLANWLDAGELPAETLDEDPG